MYEVASYILVADVYTFYLLVDMTSSDTVGGGGGGGGRCTLIVQGGRVC